MNAWWFGAVFYQIYPLSFRDSNGDGVGDLNGITECLSHVAELAVDGIWLSPFYPSPMKDFGYDVADYLGVDPRFGTLADFDRLVGEAHRLGLKVIIDQVYSHTSDRHPWFAESRASCDNPKADWYVWAAPKADGTPPNNWLSVFGGPAWHWEPRRRQYYLHNFLREQPDLNLHNPEVQQAILAVAAFWLDRGVDGFRIDVANLFCHDRKLRDNPPAAGASAVKPYRMQRPLYNRSRPETLQFVARLRALLDRYPGTMSVAEIASDDHTLATTCTYIDGPDRYHTAYSFVFLRETFGAGHLRRSVEAMHNAAPAAWPGWAFSNHDVPRAVTRWGGPGTDRSAFAKVLIAALTCLRGVAFLYQGEELGLPQADVPFDRLQDPESRRFWPAHPARDGARTPIPWNDAEPHAGFSTSEPWLPMDPAHLPLAVSRQQRDPASVLTFTRRFLRWRKARPALVQGDIRFLDADEPVLLLERTCHRQRLLCAFNLGGAAAAAEVPKGAGFRPLSGHGLSGDMEGSRLVLAPFGGVIAAAG